MAKILIIDDEPSFRESLAETIADLGHASAEAGSANEALAAVALDRFAAIFVDFRLPGTDGVQTMKLLRERLREKTPPIVMITAFSDSENTIAAMRLGAFDHLTKPVSRADIARIVNAIAASPVDPEPENPSRSGKKDSRPKILGQSPSMRDVLKMIGRLAASDATVLITGETGTGKEVVAQAIHQNSARASENFVAINCAAIPEALLESELFGHVRGAFTGASETRRGSFQNADGGTLFLDEIGDMNMTLQAKILRAVQEREVTPVGGHQPVKIDVRIIAATHRQLAQLVTEGKFRQDLLYRLDVIQLALPPLRERTEDIDDLASYFLAQASESPKRLDEGALAKLRSHAWPGNIRELRNVIERAALTARGPTLTKEDIRFADAAVPADVFDVRGLEWHDAIARVEKTLLVDALKNAKGNRSEAARQLGIQRQLLYAKMKEFGIDV